MKTPLVLLLPFAALLAVGALYPAYQHELQRWEDCFDGCSKNYASNARILMHSMCMDPFQRQSHGSHAETMCKQAERENISTPTRCAWRKFWHEGELYGVYRRFAHEPWMLYGMALPISLFCVYMCFSAYQKQGAENRKERERADMLNAMRDMVAACAPPPPPSQQLRLALPTPRIEAGDHYFGYNNQERELAKRVTYRGRKRAHEHYYHNNGATQIRLV
jgi:hypothetical protein